MLVKFHVGSCSPECHMSNFSWRPGIFFGEAAVHLKKIFEGRSSAWWLVSDQLLRWIRVEQPCKCTRIGFSRHFALWSSPFFTFVWLLWDQCNVHVPTTALGQFESGATVFYVATTSC